ncbi:MAG TPA: hypothetical protein VEJ42_01060 [Streptosporangiaceae bacterium]|nr:hypothetical protein [Streptosporangiaceae bacterium]
MNDDLTVNTKGLRSGTRSGSPHETRKARDPMMHQLLQDLATQHVAELQRAADPLRPQRTRRRHASLRVRAGWTLVGVGLRLAVMPARRPAPGSPKAPLQA